MIKHSSSCQLAVSNEVADVFTQFGCSKTIMERIKLKDSAHRH